MLSAIHMFDQTPINTGFAIGQQLGAVNSPLTPLGTALKATLDKYDARLQAQQGLQQNKALTLYEDQVKYPWKYNEDGTVNPTARLGMRGMDPDTAGPHTQQDPTTGKWFYRNTTIDNNGVPKVSWAPVSPNAPEDEKKIFENNIFANINAKRREREAANVPVQGSIGMHNIIPNATPTIQDEKAQFDADFQKMMAIMQGGGT